MVSDHKILERKGKTKRKLNIKEGIGKEITQKAVTTANIGM